MKGTIPAACACQTIWESALTKKVQPCSTSTDIIPEHAPRQLFMQSSVGDKEEA